MPSPALHGGSLPAAPASRPLLPRPPCCASFADAARETGYAPSVLEAAQKGESVYVLAVPADAIGTRLPTAADADGNPNWLPGGFTAIRVADKFFVNATHEFVTPGDQLVPPGSILTRVLENGSWEWPPMNVFSEPGLPGPGLPPGTPGIAP